MIGWNAAANNATLVVTGTDPKQKRSSSKDLDPEFRKDVEETFGEKLNHTHFLNNHSPSIHQQNQSFFLYKIIKKNSFLKHHHANLRESNF